MTAYQPHSPTSKAAAESIEPHKRTARQRVFNYIAESGEYGATDEEVQNALGMSPNTQRPRRVELGKAELIKESKIRRKTRSNRWATVWIIADNEFKQTEMF